MSIEAMKLALDALESRCGTNADERLAGGAIPALRTAIQQAEAQQPATPEPVGFTYQAEIEYADSTGGNGSFWRVPPDLDDESVPLYDHPAPSVPMTNEQWDDVLGLAGPDMFDLAKQWSNNEVHVYQVVHQAEKIVKAAVLRGITAQIKKETP